MKAVARVLIMAAWFPRGDLSAKKRLTTANCQPKYWFLQFNHSLSMNTVAALGGSVQQAWHVHPTIDKNAFKAFFSKKIEDTVKVGIVLPLEDWRRLVAELTGKDQANSRPGDTIELQTDTANENGFSCTQWSNLADSTR